MQGEEKKRKKRARRELEVFYKRLEKLHGTIQEAKEWYDLVKELQDVITKYHNEIPADAQKRLQDSANLTTQDKQGIELAYKSLKVVTDQAIHILPPTVITPPVTIGIIIAVVATGGAIAASPILMSVEVDIKNIGCEPINIPMLNQAIPTNGHLTVKAPRSTIDVDARNGAINLSVYGYHPSFALPQKVSSITFDGREILGATTSLDLGERPQHELVIRCR